LPYIPAFLLVRVKLFLQRFLRGREMPCPVDHRHQAIAAVLQIEKTLSAACSQDFPFQASQAQKLDAQDLFDALHAIGFSSEKNAEVSGFPYDLLLCSLFFCQMHAKLRSDFIKKKIVLSWVF
jgi:hypothetical protein